MRGYSPALNERISIPSLEKSLYTLAKISDGLVDSPVYRLAIPGEYLN